jgi:hypothetical protein
LANAVAAAARLRTIEINEAEIAGIARRRLLKRMIGAPFHPPLLPAGADATSRSCVRRDAKIALPLMSTITKHRHEAPTRLGSEIRRRRRALGLTQTELGRPLTRGLVSAVEHGRCLPSLSALAHFAERLQASPAELLDPVKQELASLYTAGHANGSDTLSGP